MCLKTYFDSITILKLCLGKPKRSFPVKRRKICTEFQFVLSSTHGNYFLPSVTVNFLPNPRSGSAQFRSLCSKSVFVVMVSDEVAAGDGA